MSIISGFPVMQRESHHAGGGVAFVSCPNWPLTDENALPSCVRIPLDTNDDNTIDHIATVSVRLLDDDGNGRWDRGTDRVLIDPDRLERIDKSVRLNFCERLWKLVAKRAAAGL